MAKARSCIARVAAAAGTLLIVGVTPPAFAEAAPTPGSVLDHFLPGSTVKIASPPAPGAAGALTINLPASATPSGQSVLQQEFTYRELGWRARVASGLVNQLTPISTFEVVAATGSAPEGAQDAFHGGFTGTALPVSNPTLDSLDSAATLTQLNSSIATLKSVLPTGSMTKASSISIPSGAGANQYALEADIVVDQASSVTGHFGDILQGLKTGLTGDLASTPIEGLSIVVTSADGTPVVGSWDSTRAGGGTTQFADPNARPESLQVTTTFPNLTGGPPTRIGVSGLPATGDKQKSSPTKSHRSDGARGTKTFTSQAVTHSIDEPSSEKPAAWWVTAGIAVPVAAAAAILLATIWRRVAS